MFICALIYKTGSVYPDQKLIKETKGKTNIQTFTSHKKITWLQRREYFGLIATSCEILDLHRHFWICLTREELVVISWQKKNRRCEKDFKFCSGVIS
jgi:hypothetical protein